MKKLLLATALLTATPLYAGGPVIIEDAEVAQATVRKPNVLLLGAIVGLAVAAIVLSGDSDNCTAETTTPPQTPGC